MALNRKSPRIVVPIECIMYVGLIVLATVH